MEIIINIIIIVISVLFCTPQAIIITKNYLRKRNSENNSYEEKNSVIASLFSLIGWITLFLSVIYLCALIS